MVRRDESSNLTRGGSPWTEENRYRLERAASFLGLKMTQVPLSIIAKQRCCEATGNKISHYKLTYKRTIHRVVLNIWNPFEVISNGIHWRRLFGLEANQFFFTEAISICKTLLSYVVQLHIKNDLNKLNNFTHPMVQYRKRQIPKLYCKSRLQWLYALQHQRNLNVKIIPGFAWQQIIQNVLQSSPFLSMKAR